MLSHAGKEVLIKVVAQSIPMYTMGVFLLPAKLCNELNALCARFWWGQTDDERKILWKSWNFLTKQKREGGTRFRDIRSFNLAILAKQGWRLLQDQNSLLSRCFKAKYVWKSVLAAQNILQTCCFWRVGMGSSIRVLEDKWIPNHPENKVSFQTKNDE